MALILLSRCSELIPNYNSADDTVLQDIVNACSDLIERFCNRTFAVTNYDEVYDGTGSDNLLLNNYPVLSVSAVRTVYTNVLMIRNGDQTNSRAYFYLDGDTLASNGQYFTAVPNNLYLVNIKNGSTNTVTLSCASYATLNDLATAINGNSTFGWTAQALGIFGTWPVSELRPPQGAYEARWQGAAYLKLHSWPLNQFEQNPLTGELVSPYYFVRGYQTYRVQYSAGYSAIPNPIQQACAELAAAVYLARGQNANVQGENLGGYSYTQLAEKSFNNLSIASRYSLHEYKNHRIAKYRTW